MTTKPLRVIIVEDSKDDLALTLRELKRLGYDVTFEHVEDEAALARLFDGRTWDVVISDWSLPHFSGLAALGVVRRYTRDTPFIIISGTIGEDTAVEALRAGASDFLLKGKFSRLGPAIERELRERKGREARREAEDALRESEARFRRLSESGLVGITISDDADRIVEANDAFLLMVGYKPEDLAARTIGWSDMTPPRSSSASISHVLAREQLRASGVTRPSEREYLHKDGHRVPVLAGEATLEGSRNISILLDLSERKRLEDQLRQAQKMEAVGRLAGGVAHDFNNILSVILCYASLVEKALPSADPIRADVDQIRKAGTRAADLTRQLLTFSRQEVVEARVIDVNILLADTNKMLQRILGEDVDLVFLLESGVGRINVNPSHIEQVIMNLVVNARDAMPKGGKLTIETKNVVLSERHAREHLGVRPGRYVMLAVSDTGTGMDQATQARIFEPFFTTKEVGSGTGLGLSTVFGIVQQCEGSIWVYSEVGTGTTFKVYIPLVDAAIDVNADSAPPTTLRGTETILLVEDEDQIRAVARVILRRQGYQVLEARNAGEALHHCETYKDAIHLMVTDVVMPQMSGPDLAKHFALVRPEARVLFMSGYTDDALIRHGALQAGIAYLQKPITPDILIRKVRTVLDAGVASVYPSKLPPKN